ncbi:hypothetical protein KFK09_013365 [Dendrobium nobile]|uniref:DUF4283 domain-containing protein n=1 Tax=Dendrobium nobile TaxID=94219 RepID=A0A8T3B747_DENNO|nr:hypothetical protein KFK09_013365 [Dendrobium nobile]
MQLLSLSDGFFLLHFTTTEDYEKAWIKEVWFFLGRPFLLQKWSPKSCPKRENLTSIPNWVKIHYLPLVCWNSEGISRIASKIGIPLAVDALTAQRTRLTFARVCIQVDVDATYPEEIPISIEDDPSPYEHCKSLVHSTSFRPTKPETAPLTAPTVPPTSTTAHGQSKSRRPQGRNAPSSSTIPPTIIPSSIILYGHHSIAQPPSSSTLEPLLVQNNPASSTPQLPPHTNNHSLHKLPPLPDNPPPSTIPLVETPASNILNLNYPHGDTSSSTSTSIPTFKSSPPKVHSPNQFDALHLLEEEQYNSAECSNLDTDQIARIRNEHHVGLALQQRDGDSSNSLDAAHSRLTLSQYRRKKQNFRKQKRAQAELQEKKKKIEEQMSN